MVIHYSSSTKLRYGKWKIGTRNVFTNIETERVTGFTCESISAGTIVVTRGSAVTS